MKLTRRRRIGVLSMEKVVTAVEQTKPADLGIEVNGSSEKGHEVKLCPGWCTVCGLRKR